MIQSLPTHHLQTQTQIQCQAFVLAAGRGERMRPLTDTCPKPMLTVRGMPLIAWHLKALAGAGFRHIAINTAWLEDTLITQLGTGTELGAQLHYSQEGRDFGHALETAGGIARALPMLDDVFWVVAGDVFVPDFVFGPTAYAAFESSDQLAHLWLVPNPPHNPAGDFGLSAQGLALNLPKPSRGAPDGWGSQAPAPSPSALWTYSTIGLYKQAFFTQAGEYSLAAGNPSGIKAALAPLLRYHMNHGKVSAQLYQGSWTDVGTPQRLEELNT